MEPKDMKEAIQKVLDAGEGSTHFRGISRRLANEKVTKETAYRTEEVKRLHESMKRQYGIDIFNEKDFPVRNWDFSWKKLKAKLEEADSASSFVQFLRAGIQNITLGMYETVKTSYEDWVQVVSSSRDTELYAPNQGVSFPRQIGEQSRYPEVTAAALDIKLKNYKYGAMYNVTWELLEDDQTGSFQRQAAVLGEYMKILCEVLVYGKLASQASVTQQYIDYVVPVSETKPVSESVYPWSTSLVGGGSNRPASFGSLNQVNIQNGIIALMQQKNLQGIRMQVNPTRLLISPVTKFDAAILMHSAYYPSGAAAAGSTGGAFAINPIQNLLDITVSRFMFNNLGSVDNSKAWYIVDDTKPWFILQEREPIAVQQENPQSGLSFELDEFRFKARSRKNADFLDPRFAWQGNDGSV